MSRSDGVFLALITVLIAVGMWATGKRLDRLEDAARIERYAPAEVSIGAIVTPDDPSQQPIVLMQTDGGRLVEDPHASALVSLTGNVLADAALTIPTRTPGELRGIFEGSFGDFGYVSGKTALELNDLLPMGLATELIDIFDGNLTESIGLPSGEVPFDARLFDHYLGAQAFEFSLAQEDVADELLHALYEYRCSVLDRMLAANPEWLLWERMDRYVMHLEEPWEEHDGE